MDEQANVEKLQKIVAKTKGWLMFLGVVGVIGGSIYGLYSLVSFIDACSFGGFYGGGTIFASIIYMFSAVVVLYMGILLIKISQSADRYVRTSNLVQLRGYLDGLRKYFKITGWMAIIGFILGLMTLAIAAAFI